MYYSKILDAFHELLNYNAYFSLEFGYARSTGWTLLIGNRNAGIYTYICSMGGENPAELWTKAEPILAKLQAAYINADETPNWTMQSCKNSLFTVCPAERLNKLCKIQEDGFLLHFTANQAKFTLDAQKPDLAKFQTFISAITEGTYA